jgi:hypothetical protein
LKVVWAGEGGGLKNIVILGDLGREFRSPDGRNPDLDKTDAGAKVLLFF